MNQIDLTKGDRTYVVPTKVVRFGIAFMGPDVKVTARDTGHAAEQVKAAGHELNSSFPVK